MTGGFRVACYDPRDLAQSASAPDTWRETSNPALIMAHLLPEWMKAMDGFWQNTARNADYCDEEIPFRENLNRRAGELTQKH